MGKTTLDRIFAPLHRNLPRIIAGVWCAWSWGMVLAYVDGAPNQLISLERSVPFQLWILWLIAAAFLTLGTVLPLRGRYQRVSRCARIYGLTMVTVMLMLWSVAFFTADMSRGWVSAKNYLLLAFFSVFTSYFIARDRPSPVHNLVEGRPIE